MENEENITERKDENILSSIDHENFSENEDTSNQLDNITQESETELEIIPDLNFEDIESVFDGKIEERKEPNDEEILEEFGFNEEDYKEQSDMEDPKISEIEKMDNDMDESTTEHTYKEIEHDPISNIEDVDVSQAGETNMDIKGKRDIDKANNNDKNDEEAEKDTGEKDSSKYILQENTAQDSQEIFTDSVNTDTLDNLSGNCEVNQIVQNNLLAESGENMDNMNENEDGVKSDLVVVIRNIESSVEQDYVKTNTTNKVEKNSDNNVISIPSKDINMISQSEDKINHIDQTAENFDNKPISKPPTPNKISDFFTVHIQMDDGTIKNQIVTIVRPKVKKPFIGGYRHKISGIEYHNASIQTKPRPRPPPDVELFSRDTQTFQVRHQKVNTNNTTSTQMARPGIFVSNITDNVIIPGKYETADEYKERLLKNIIIIQKYYRRWLAKNIVDSRRKERDERLAWEQHEKKMKLKEKEEHIKREYDRRMHPKTRADFDLLYNGLERWRQEQLAEINNGNNSEAEKKAGKLLLLDEETDLLAAIDRHKIDRSQQSKGEAVQKLLSKAAAPKSWKDAKGRKVEMDTPYTIRSRELLDILNSLNMQYLTSDERLDVLLTLKHTVKEHDCKLTRDIIDLVDREADLIMRDIKDSSLAGLRKRIVTLFLQYCKTPTFNPEISLLLKVPQDPSVLIGDINYCKFCGRYLRSTEFSLSTKSLKLTICKSCARKENQSRNRQDYSHYRRILKDIQMNEQQIEDGSKIAFIFKQNDIKTLLESVWDSKSILSECEDLDELIFVRWNCKQHWSPWNTVLLTKDEAEAHQKVSDLSETYSNVMINRIGQKHVIAKNMFDSLEKMADPFNGKIIKTTVKV